MSIPAIFGLSGPILLQEEKCFLQKYQPAGIILFRRNCDSKEQIKNYINEIKNILGECAILIDQEGGKVRRLRGKEFWEAKAFQTFGDIARFNLEDAEKLTRYSYYLIGLDLQELGITHNCAPVADLHYPSITTNALDTRTSSDDVNIITVLCRAAIEGLESAGISGIVKHLPGHGLAREDTHYLLATVSEDERKLSEYDFKVFKNLAQNSKWAMTAHVIFNALDSENPVTLSKQAITKIRSDLNYQDNIIISDAIEMKALATYGSFADIALKCLDAGCDIVLHCEENLENKMIVAEALKNKDIKIADIIQKFHKNYINKSRAEIIAEFKQIIDKYIDDENNHKISKLQKHTPEEIDTVYGLNTDILDKVKNILS